MSLHPSRIATVAVLFTLAAVCAFAVSPASAVEPHGGMLRYPDVSASHVVFVYANDLWLVPRQGGTAIPLASPPGAESFPRFDADGDTIAFMGNYDGGTDIYTVPVAGGAPFRVTYHPDTEILTDWTPDGRLLFWSWGRQWYPRAQELFSVPSTGGLPEKLPIPYGAAAAISGDGAWLAYTPHTRDQRTWKRYRGGMATDIWLFHLTEHTARRITEWEGTDTLPMWHDGTIYYLSDAGPSHRLNLWRYDPASGERAQITDYTGYDVKWPAIGPGADGGGEIVFQHAGDLVLLDLASGASRTVEVTIPGARPKLRTQRTAVADLIRNQTVSPSGKRAVVEARGDIWTLPAEHGSPRNLTRTSGVAERDPAWSPDGESIAYFSDESGEYELYVRPVDGFSAPRRLTEGADRFLYSPVWSPDSRYIAYWDRASRLWIYDVEAETDVEVHKNAAQSATSVSWSHDARWLAFATPDGGRQPNRIRLYEVDAGRLHTVTSSMFNDTWPTFDREGDFLYFASQREFSDPIYEDIGTTWVYTHTDRLYAVPLRDDVSAPRLPRSDEEEVAATEEDEKAENGEEEDATNGETADGEPEPVAIDLDGFEARTVALPVDRGNFVNLYVNDAGHLLYG
ncbi:MAG: peptidase S41, partial [Thermoanaerobaculia bacterium]|nr:peptidase S41 [Thermoanaerobaculia bacterium]